MKKIIITIIILLSITVAANAHNLLRFLYFTTTDDTVANGGPGPSGDGFISSEGNYFISSEGNYFTSN